MLILGLGSNTGDRLNNLRQARLLLEQVPRLSIQQVSPLYRSNALLPEQAPASWDQPYLNLAIRCETTLQPHDLLHRLKNIEYAIGRKPLKKHWGPRIIDIDILAWDDRVLHDETLQLPHPCLPERPFALWPLADLAPYWIYPVPGNFQGKTAAELCLRFGSRFSGAAALNTLQILHRIDTPRLMGILNITPDSFSDGGKFPNLQSALHQAYHLASSGAEILDLGAEATNPEAIPLEAEDEWERLEPVLTAIKNELHHMFIPPKISIDTRHPEVAEKALRKGVDWINDTSGLQDPKMCALLATYRRDGVLMHNLGIPADKNRILCYSKNPVEQVYHWAETQLMALEKQGIAREKIIFDVGLGFGKDAEQSFALLKNINQFSALKTRLLVGHSRKSFLQKFTSKAPVERDVETTVLSNFLAGSSVDYLRVHDVEACSRSFKVLKHLP
jgi:2-amino-4-hydroxy-6-hydroxymethyldihydropteridine diphosphokinase/dihydropteroate synthase